MVTGLKSEPTYLFYYSLNRYIIMLIFAQPLLIASLLKGITIHDPSNNNSIKGSEIIVLYVVEVKSFGKLIVIENL